MKFRIKATLTLLLPLLILSAINTGFKAIDTGDFISIPFSQKGFLSVDRTGTYVTYFTVFDNGRPVKKFITISSSKKGNYFINYDPVQNINIDGHDIDLVYFNYGLFEIKPNVITFLNSDFFQKLIFIFHKLNFVPRVTDAIRTQDKQIKYKRRGWSSVESSPHILGLAVDMTIYGSSEREKIKTLSEKLKIKFLYHGAGANRHVHLQDEKQWQEYLKSNTRVISDTIFSLLKTGVKKIDTYQFDTLNVLDGSDFSCNISCGTYSTINFTVNNLLGEKVAEIKSGIYEEGNYPININLLFLKKGFYTVNISVNNKFIEQKYFVRY